MDKPSLFSLLGAVLLCLLAGCAGLSPSEIGNIPHGADFHAVGKEWGIYKYNVSSYSDINHGGKGGETLQSLDLKEVTSGEYKGFKWSVYSTDGSYAFASHFRQPQSFNKEEKAGKSKKIVIPSWRQQFESLVDMIHQIIGDRAPPFNLRLNLIEDSIKNTFSETNHSNTLIPLEFSIPVSVKKSDSEEGFSWQIDALTVPAHEYLHTYFFYAAKHPPLNSVSNEIVAYTFQRCVEIGLMHGEGGLEFDDHGKPINVNRIPLPGIKLSSDQVAPTSIDGGLYSIYNIVHFLGKDEIKSSDLAAKQRLFGLCSAMIHRPVDLSKEYYPTNAG